MSRFRIAELAKTDLAEIREYIARDKPGAADRQIPDGIEIARVVSGYRDLDALF